MLINPHTTCANILDTLRSSGLTYTLNETPYSVYLTVRKKFIKEYTHTQSTQNSQATTEQNNNVVDMSKYEDVLAKLHDEISNHISTKHELSEREEDLSKAVEANNWNIEDSRLQHFRQVETISKLTAELAQEVDEHAQSEAAIRKLEEKLENYQIQLEEKVNHAARLEEEKVSLVEKNERLEDSIKEKNSNISLLKGQVKSSHNEIAKLRQQQPNSASHDTPILSPSQSGSLSGIFQLNIDTSASSPIPPKQSPLDTNTLNTQSFSPSSHHRKNCEKYCQNCKNELPEELDIEIPPPVYFYDFLSECPSPWLHYGYCKPCLEVARHTGTEITQHIEHCPAFVDQCWDGEHELLIAQYQNTESEKHKLDQNENKPPSSSHLHLSTPKSNTRAPCSSSNQSSPGPYYRTSPNEYCQNCKNEISDKADIQLPCPVQYFDFITECPSPWLHYGYCTPCLEAARLRSPTEIIEHITQCEALVGQCWENQHENHIKHYQHTEAE